MSSSEVDSDDDFQQRFGFQSQLPNIPDRERIPLPPSSQTQGQLKQWNRETCNGYILPLSGKTLSGKTLDEGEVCSICSCSPCCLQFIQARLYIICYSCVLYVIKHGRPEKRLQFNPHLIKWKSLTDHLFAAHLSQLNGNPPRRRPDCSLALAQLSESLPNLRSSNSSQMLNRGAQITSGAQIEALLDPNLAQPNQQK